MLRIGSVNNIKQNQPAFGINLKEALDTARLIVKMPADEGSKAQRLLTKLGVQVDQAGQKLKQELTNEAAKLRTSKKPGDSKLAELLDILV